MAKRNVCRVLICLLAFCAFAAQVEAQDNNKPPQGFTALIGEDLSNWIGGTTHHPGKITEDQQAKWNQAILKHWRIEGNELISDGRGPHLATAKEYGDFELWVDWKILAGGDSGIYVRGCPQVQIWDPTHKPSHRHGSDKGSGGLWNNEENRWPSEVADNPIGEWNRMYIRMVGSYITVKLNGKTVVDNVVFENYFERENPVFKTGTIHLQTHGSETRFRNVFLREIPEAESKRLLDKIEKKAGR